MATLIKIDRNGSKHFEGMITCDRCGGQGFWEGWKATGMTCWKCGGTGKVFGKWIERTPEYEAKLAARRQAKYEAKMAQWEAEEAELEKQRKIAEEAERLAKEAEKARIKAKKAISQFIGQIGDKITVIGAFDHSAWYTAHMGWMENTVYIHTFKDPEGNVIIWKTQKGLNLNYGEPVEITGTVKDHSVYEDEKQTVLTRCKVVAK